MNRIEIAIVLVVGLLTCAHAADLNCGYGKDKDGGCICGEYAKTHKWRCGIGSSSRRCGCIRDWKNPKYMTQNHWDKHKVKTKQETNRIQRRVSRAQRRQKRKCFYNGDEVGIYDYEGNMRDVEIDDKPGKCFRHGDEVEGYDWDKGEHTYGELDAF